MDLIVGQATALYIMQHGTIADPRLQAEYSGPEFRALLTDQDKIEISELLPDHISLTEEGFFRDEFVRYDMDFKNAVRLYQQDLAAGRYDPDWLQQAAQAMEQRANGDFDKWKDQEFEEFWGQKQKLDTRARAGQSGTVKLNRLVEAGLFKEGDVFSYMRTFGRGKGKFTVEKDVKVCPHPTSPRYLVSSLLTWVNRLSRSTELP